MGYRYPQGKAGSSSAQGYLRRLLDRCASGYFVKCWWDMPQAMFMEKLRTSRGNPADTSQSDLEKVNFKPPFDCRRVITDGG